MTSLEYLLQDLSENQTIEVEELNFSKESEEQKLFHPTTYENDTRTTTDLNPRFTFTLVSPLVYNKVLGKVSL